MTKKSLFLVLVAIATLLAFSSPLVAQSRSNLLDKDTLRANLAGMEGQMRMLLDFDGPQAARLGPGQLVTAPEVGARLAAYAAREEARLSPAALEALAVIAYRQPCTRADVERVRGVDSDYVIRSLLHRRLVVELGRRDTPGRPVLFGTTFTFLERFGLTSTEDLPPLSSDAAQLAALANTTDGQ